MIVGHRRAVTSESEGGAGPTSTTGVADRGVVGGIEVLPFAVLIFVVGSLIFVNAWAVVDAKLAVEHSAREATRAYVEAGDGRLAPGAADRAAREALAGTGRDPDRLAVTSNDPGYRRCTVVAYETSYRLPALSVPFLGSIGRGPVVRGRHREVLDPYASGGDGEVECG